MNRKILVILFIVIFSGLAFLLTYYLIGWTWKKSLIISGGAGVAMIIFDVVLGKKKF